MGLHSNFERPLPQARNFLSVRVEPTTASRDLARVTPTYMVSFLSSSTTSSPTHNTTAWDSNPLNRETVTTSAIAPQSCLLQLIAPNCPFPAGRIIHNPVWRRPLHLSADRALLLGPSRAKRREKQKFPAYLSYFSEPQGQLSFH